MYQIKKPVCTIDGITYNYTQTHDPMSVSAESYLENLVVKSLDTVWDTSFIPADVDYQG